jgi:uncharacterized SAM-binding protein YcdF (DUF218 family)
MNFRKGAIHFTNILLKTSGLCFLLFIALSLTDLPYYAYHWLGTGNSRLSAKPDLIVLLGGAGMPSPDGFIRCYYTWEAASANSHSTIIIALPSGAKDSTHQSDMMAGELIMRGIDSSRIFFERDGFNTRTQALNIAQMKKGALDKINLLIITSPEHMYRSVGTFRKAGFQHVGGYAAFEKPVEEEGLQDRLRTKDQRIKSTGLRYNIWSYMQYELLVIKEFFALSYYKLKGWI